MSDGNMDYPIPSSAELTPGEQQLDTRIAVATNALMNTIARHGEKNGRVWACALLQLLEHNPELAQMFETLCANFKVRVVLNESRKLHAVQRDLRGA